MQTDDEMAHVMNQVTLSQRAEQAEYAGADDGLLLLSSRRTDERRSGERERAKRSGLTPRCGS